MRCRRSARSRHSAPQREASLFDHLIGASEDILWDFQPQRFRNRHVDRHVELRGLLDRQIAWLRAAQNLVHVIGGAPEQVWEVGVVVAVLAANAGARAAARISPGGGNPDNLAQEL